MRTVEHAVRVRARGDAIERLRPAVLLSSRWLRDDSTQAPRHPGTSSRALRGLRKLSILHGSPFRLVWASPTGLDSCLATAPVHTPPHPPHPLPPTSSAPAKAGRQSHRPRTALRRAFIAGELLSPILRHGPALHMSPAAGHARHPALWRPGISAGARPSVFDPGRPSDGGAGGT